MALVKKKKPGVEQDNFLSIVPTRQADIGEFVPRTGSKSTQTTEAERRQMHNFKPILRGIPLTPDEKVALIENIAR